MQKKRRFFPENCKGSHVGMVLSFAIFITFLVFLYSVVEPAIEMQKGKQTILDYLKTELTKEFSANLTSVAVGINKNINKDCINLEDLITEAEINSRLIVKSNSGDIFAAKISGDDLFIDRGSTDTDFFKIYLSEEFEAIESGTMDNCENLKKEHINGYTIGLIRTEENIFETRIIALKDEYENDYENLKNTLKIPAGDEFGFSFSYNNGTKTGTEEKNISADVYAEETPIQYIDKNASLLSGFLNIKAW